MIVSTNGDASVCALDAFVLGMQRNTFYNLGVTYWAMDRPDRALDYFIHYLKYQPEDVDAMLKAAGQFAFPFSILPSPSLPLTYCTESNGD